MTLHYSVRIEDPNSHYAAFRLRVDRPGDAPFDLVLPSWVPGSYMIQDPARHLVDLKAFSSEGGGEIPVTRREKARWTVGGSGGVEVRYRVYGHQMITEALDVSPEHLFLNGTLCLPYVEGRREEGHEIAFELPPGWRILTDLPEAPGHPSTYRAPNYDDLVDSPIDCGTPTVLTIHPSGIPHRLVFCGPGGNYEPHRVEEDLGRIVESTIRYMGSSPLKGYTFFYHLNETSDGGLEHRSSNSCVVPRLTFRPESAYQWFLWLSAHEYFHLYNVKRIQPAAHIPFDYTREVYTRLLWLMEGTTDYVSLLMLRRAGLNSPAKYLERLAGEIKKLSMVPGRHHQSLEDASFVAWIDYYHRGEETGNRSVSYYIKGHLVSWCLDLELRDRSEGRRSLQDVMQHLWTEYGEKGRGIPEDAFPSIVARSTGIDITEFHRRYIAGTEEIDFDRFARLAGLTFGPVPKKPEPEEDGEPGYLGAEYRIADGMVRLTAVRDGGPGRHAGLSPGDEVIALDGVKVVPSDFEEMLKRFPPGTTTEVTLFRRGFLQKVPVTFGRAPPAKYQFRPLAEATPVQRALYEAWIGSPWEPAKKPGSD